MPSCRHALALALALGCVGELSSVAIAQGEPLYPAVDLPPAIEVAADESPAPAPPASPLVQATDGGFDATQFTPSLNLDVRDLDGDGHLDGTWLLDGVRVWHGRGDGRFDSGSFHETALPSSSQILGQWADADADGDLDAVYLTYEQTEVFFDQGGGRFVSSGPQTIPGDNDFNFNSWTAGFVDGDALVDIVARNYHVTPGAKVQVLHGLGGGAFSAPFTVATTAGTVTETALPDLDADGRTDIVSFVDNNPTFRLRSWLQPAEGTFISVSNVLTPGYVFRLEARDMTGDGLADVIAFGLDQAWLYVGDGTGVLPLVPVTLPGVRHDALFLDVDLDGLTDVLQTSGSVPFGPEALLARIDGSLSAPVRTRHGTDVLGVGDFDGDGVLDLWSVQAALRGRGDGSFEVPLNFAIDDGSTESPRVIALSDFDEDGVLDVITTGFPYVTLSAPGGAWDPPHLVAAYFGVAVAAGDIDGDGHADLVSSRPVLGGTDVWRGLGNGQFHEQAPLIFSPGENTGIGIGEFGGTGGADVVGSTDGRVRVRLGSGDFTFGAERQTALPLPSNDPWLVVRDLDRDGLDDLLVSQSSGLYSLRCLGNGLFAPPVGVSPTTFQLSFADLDGDGDEDLLASQGNGVTALLADGTGGFAPAPFAGVTVATQARGTAVADVDGDGWLDLAVGHFWAWSLFRGVPGGGWETQPLDVFDLSGTGEILRFVDANSDGAPDLIAVGANPDFGSFDDTIGLTLALHRQGRWEDLGFGLAGATAPYLWPSGSLQAGSPVRFVLRDAQPGEFAVLVIGLAELHLAFKGGVLVPAPHLLVTLGPVNPAGVTLLTATWPAMVPPGTRLWVQGWIPDAGAPVGLAASNAVAGTSP